MTRRLLPEGALLVAVSISISALFLSACGPAVSEGVPPKRADPPPAIPEAAEPSASASQAAAAPAAPSKKATLRFDAGGDEFPSPLVDVVVSGNPTSMIVDTGASHHIVASWVVGDAGLGTATGGAGLDHAGKAVALARFDGGNLVVSGWGRVPTPETLVAALPDALKRQGIGGVLSPQTLVDDTRAVTLDLRKNTMTDAPVDDALRALAAQSGTEMKGEVRDCGVGGGLMFVKATIGGNEVEAQIDTGATTTTVQATSAAGKALRPRAKGQSSAVAASGVFTVPAAEGIHLSVGSFEMDTRIDLVPGGGAFQCGNSAFLGMDVLRRCVLVIGAKVFAAKCVAPPS